MNKNKKLISLVCAIAMIFSMLSGLAITASAAGEGVTFSTPVAADATYTKFTVDVGYKGFANGMAAGRIKIAMPDNVVKVESNPISAPDAPIADGIYTYMFAWQGTEKTTTEDKITTLTITLSEPLKEAFELKAADKTYLTDAANGRVNVEDMTACESVNLPTDPNAPTPKPVTTKEPGAVEEEPTPNPDKPVVKDPVTATAGYTLDNLVVDGNTATVDLNYIGSANGLAAGRVKIKVPDYVKSIASNPISAPDSPISNGVYTYMFAWQGTEKTETSGSVSKLTLTLDENRPYETQLEIGENSYYIDTTNTRFNFGDAGFLASNANIPASEATSKPNRPYVIPMSKAVGDLDLSDDDAAANAGESKYWIDITVKKDDDTAAVYDTDYIATVEVNGEEVELTKAQFNNAVNGHLGKLPANLGITKMSDVAEKVKIKMNTNGKVSAPVIRNRADAATGEEKGTILNADVGEVTAGPAKPTDAPKDASVKVTADKTKISADGSAKVTATVTQPDAKLLGTAGTTVKFEIANTDILEFDENVADPSAVTLKADNTATVRVFAKKVGKTTVKATYTYTNKAGGSVSKDDSVTITVASTSVGGDTGDSSGKKQSGTSIAPGNSNLGGISNGIIGTFSDIDSVDWAKEAITLLSLKGIVSGRGDGTFAPNDNITRAEYCQILIGAINKTNEYADSAFADVPSDAWFYHAVSVASENGIVSGYGDGNFGPYDLITRQDMALMTYKAAQVMNKNLSSVRTMSFADAGSISEYAATAVQTLADAAIINGVSDTEFAPRANATRAQAAKILYDTFVKQN